MLTVPKVTEKKKKRGHILVRLNRNDITGVQTPGTKRKRGIVCVRRRGTIRG